MCPEDVSSTLPYSSTEPEGITSRPTPVKETPLSVHGYLQTCLISKCNQWKYFFPRVPQMFSISTIQRDGEAIDQRKTFVFSSNKSLQTLQKNQHKVAV